MSENKAVNTQGEPEGNPDKLPETEASAMPLGPNNPYFLEHVYPKPDGDLWEILLKPELEADTTRCTAWKDEVQNLLIFAGLFSAVVTTFIVESYKFLQPDPNATIEGLLFHIANSLNNTSPLPPSLVPVPFSQPSSSVRINIFWFISLVLSLTTVLIGTISLQWLREHQSYPDVSSKEKLAIFHMRSEALNVWCVPQIFSALPVLLQGALALFLVGLIDFVLPLGRKLTLPVSVIIGLTLLFLAATTALPTCQGFLFLTGFYPYSKPPSPCAFKSPQSRVLLSIFGPLIRMVSYVIFQVYDFLCFYPSIYPSICRRYTALPFLHKVLRQRTWPNWDREWLRLRDAYHQCILDKDPDLDSHQQLWSRLDLFPVSDITQYLVKSVLETPTVKDKKVFLSTVIHCFDQISASIWLDIPKLWKFIARRNDYFEKLHGKPACSISKYFLHSGYYTIPEDDKSTGVLEICNQDQMLYFLGLIHKTHPSSGLDQCRLELWLHIMSKIETLPIMPMSTDFDSLLNLITPISTDSDSLLIPTLVEFKMLESIFYDHSPKSADRLATKANILSAVFKSAASHHISEDQFVNSLYTHSNIAIVLDQLASLIASDLESTQNVLKDLQPPPPLLPQDMGVYSKLSRKLDLMQQRFLLQWQTDKIQVNAQCIPTFQFVANHLIHGHETLSNSERNSEEDIPSALFYLASIFMSRFLDHQSAWNELKNKDSDFGQGVKSLLEALLQYRTRLAGKKNDVLETRFAQQDYSIRKAKDIDRFSEEWWELLFEYSRDIGLKDTEQGPAATEEDGQNSHPSPSSQDEQKVAIVVTTRTTPSPPSASSAIVHNSRASNAVAPDSDVAGHNKISHTSLPSESVSLMRTVPSQDDHHRDTKRQALSDSPTTSEYVMATNEVLSVDPIPDSPLMHLQTSQRAVPNPPGIRLPESDHVASESAIQAPSSLQTPPQSAAGVGTGPQEVAANTFGDEQAPIQTGVPHLTIEVKSPIDLELVQTADAGDGAPEDQPKLEDAVVLINSLK